MPRKAWQNEWGAPTLLRPFATHGHLERFSAAMAGELPIQAFLLLDPGAVSPSLGVSACLEAAETSLQLVHATLLLAPHRRRCSDSANSAVDTVKDSY